MPTRPALDARPLEKRIGLIILATDHTTEPDFRRMVASDRIGVYVARIPYANPTTPENLAQDAAGADRGRGADPARRRRSMRSAIPAPRPRW